MRDFLLSRPSSMLSRTTFENMMKFRTLMYNNDNNYMNDDSGDETSDNNSDDFIECDEDLQRVKQLDELIGSLQNVSFETIIPNSYVQMVTTVPNVRVLKSNDHIVSLQTFIRNKNTPRDEFIFNADRLIRIVIEEGLNHLPYTTRSIETPTGDHYDGVQFLKMNCGVSIVRSGEAMEKALRDCCRAIRIGKILIQSDDETHQASVLYSKFPADLPLRKVLLLYPIMGTGNTVIKAVKTLIKHGAKQSNIILVNLFTTPEAIRSICTRFHEMIVQTTEVHPVVPHHFGQKYFGTD
ncbi:uracil phosphoribosyltransferase krishah [Dermatophagoides pteronyssinus]|nr:uracil phosphoribosyltransferase homolog isoform X2 [Dermatophagoides pteronyssinus]